MEWLRQGWHKEQWIALVVGLVAGVALVLVGRSGWAEFGAVMCAVGLRWAIWQIPPTGRSRAVGTPPDAWSRLGQLAVAALLITLVLEIALTPLR